MPFGVWLLLQRPTRLADGFGHAQLPYSHSPPAMLPARELKRNSPQETRFPRFQTKFGQSFFQLFSFIFVKRIISLIFFNYKALFSGNRRKKGENRLNFDLVAPESERCDGLPELLRLFIIFACCLVNGSLLCYLYCDELGAKSCFFTKIF